MAKRKMMIPEYGTVMLNGIEYYRTRIEDADGKLVALYARTPEELYNKETNALEQINNATFHRKSPTVAEYCEKWLLMQSVHVRATTDPDTFKLNSLMYESTRLLNSDLDLAG